MHANLRTRWSDRAIPWLIIAAAVAHIVVAVAASPSWHSIATRGVWNSVANDDYAAMTTLWFTVSGIGLLGFGLLARRAVLATGSMPPDIGWILLAIGIPVTLLEPVSGGWALAGIGLLTVVTSTNRHRPQRAAVSADRDAKQAP